jgi:hypothetical protein
MWYTNESLTGYYAMYKQRKLKEAMRKEKVRKAKIRKEKLKKMKLRAGIKLERQRIKEDLIAEKKRAKEEKMELLKQLGYQKGYTPKNPLKRHKRSRDLELSRQMWEKRRNGASALKLAFEYGIHPITVMRHVKEYQLYLNLKNNPIDILE